MIVTNGFQVSAILFTAVAPIGLWLQKQFCSYITINVSLLNLVINCIQLSQLSAILLNVVVPIGPWSPKQFCSCMAINDILPNVIQLKIVTNDIQISVILMKRHPMARCRRNNFVFTQQSIPFCQMSFCSTL